ncbi:hypothetical protein SynMVIR181_01130 [Synechococcus sp. MVIR-18-1]|nr:hypothetical protein SynMVIR181_01130 [Synechococcus sp. MVIR-18-1]
MAMKQLIWMIMESSGSPPFSADIPNCLTREMPISPWTGENKLFISATT